MSSAQGNRQLLRVLPSRLPASQGGRGRATTRGGPGHLPPPQLLPCCSQTPQPFLGQDLSPGGADGSVPRHGCSPAAPGQMRGEVVGSGGLRASESCSAGACAVSWSQAGFGVPGVWGDPWAPQRRKQDSLRDRNTSHHSHQILQDSQAFGWRILASRVDVPGARARPLRPPDSEEGTKGRSPPLF